MEAKSFFPLSSSLIRPHRPILPTKSLSRSTPFGDWNKPKKNVGRVSAKMGREGYDRNFRGRLVDESMIVLRKRIHEMKMVERNYEAPSDWMEWEKQYYTSYDSRICEAVGMLQTQLMNMRPSMALGTIALLTLSVPTSAVLITLRLIEAANGML